MGYRASRISGAAALAGALALATVIGGCQNGRAKPARPLIQAPITCADIDFPIYFGPRSAAITREADQLIAVAHDRARGCEVSHLAVVGLADAVGAPDANLQLSKRRAEAVSRALRRHGFTSVEFHEHAAGAMGASTAAGDTRPLRRRADVSIQLRAPSGRR